MPTAKKRIPALSARGFWLCVAGLAAVKLALASAWTSAAWTEDDRAGARGTLGAAASSALEALAARVDALELQGGAEITRHTFAADLASLANLTAAGVWNEAQARLEF